MDIDQQLDAISNRRFASQARAESRLEKREKIAEKMIGELNFGKFYVYPVGGKYRESCIKQELINYLIKNGYA